MRQPLLPRLSRAALADRNRLARRRAPLQAELAGRPWLLALRPRVPGRAPRDGLVDLSAEWGLAPVLLRAGGHALGGLVQQALGVELPDEMPALLRRAMLEAAFGPAMTQLERASGRRLHLADAGTAAAPAAHGIDWQVQVGGLLSEGELWTDDAGLQQLADQWAAPVPADPDREEPGSDPRFEQLPLVLRLAVGWVDLPAAQLATLSEHDVLLLDETWLRPDGGIALRIGRDSALIGRIDGTRIVITQAWTDIMDDRMKDDDFDDEFDDDFDDDDDDDEDEDEDEDDEDEDEGLDEFAGDDDEDDSDDPAEDAPDDEQEDPPRGAPLRRLPAEQPAPQRLQPPAEPAAAIVAAVAPPAATGPDTGRPAVLPAPATRRSVARHLGTLPVRLSFDLGQRTLTLAELRDIGPGHVFELGRDLRRCVIVRANGRPIGEGELVDIDGRIGVSLLSVNGAA